MRILLASLLIVLASCASKSPLPKPQRFTSSDCQQAFQKAALEGANKQLNRLSDLFVSRCYGEVITLGSHVRDHNRDKFYNITAEVAELATPEGTWTEYTLESYERFYLSLLMALSYLSLGDKEAAQVELRKSVMDENAKIYNYGYDPVITLLQATIWSNIDPIASRPFWKRLSEEKNLSESVRQFYENRVKEIDQSAIPTGSWKILGYGSFPELEWGTDLIQQKKGFFAIRSKGKFPEKCATASTLLISTSSWAEKLSRRHERDYHPLLYTKSIARAPFGLVYGAVGVGSGVAFGAAGCVIGGYLRSGEICEAFLKGAEYIISKTGNIVAYTMAPDLRHWENVPTAFYIVRDPIEENAPKCLSEELLKYSVIKSLWD